MKLNNSNKIIAIKNNEKIGELYDIICNKIYNYSIRYCVGLYIWKEKKYNRTDI